MRILYIGYWGANEGISQGTININLPLLFQVKQVECVYYSSLERHNEDRFELPEIESLIHLPYYSRSCVLRILTKFSDLLGYFQHNLKIAREHKIQLVICRSSLAGIIGYLIYKYLRVPYSVESFEPHADYMRELGVWPSWGISYRFQNVMESFQKKTARFLLPVSQNYYRQLITEDIAKDRLGVGPCVINHDLFAFDPTKRTAVRARIGIKEDELIGVYVGKFGGIYLKEEAFQLFGQGFKVIPKLHIILLTPMQTPFDLSHLMAKFNIPLSRIHITQVQHDEVDSYLSASDFAYSTINPSVLRRFCCPIKNGEYWANGLPIMSTPDVGDDSDFIDGHPQCGVIFDPKDISSMERAHKEILKIINKRIEISSVTKDLRATELMLNNYQKILQSIND